MSIIFKMDGTLDVEFNISFQVESRVYKETQRTLLETKLDAIKNRLLAEYDLNMYDIKVRTGNG